MKTIGFGDNVRLLDTPLTRKLGVAGHIGPVHGETIPSSSGVEMIGEGDHAVAVWFEDRQEALWFAPDLLEFVDHGEGTEIVIDGSPVKFIRQADGGWDQHPNFRRKPWWRFWASS